ncbi:odorant receptor 82a [Diachasma alloeum]|uniref:Odorant receptor n=1 Tax=Diachasma alloeum TaxID=454923 RepID=A0A4E0S1A5_9HYME|nr:odorant receptor 82a [Diachasma alloeum]XP_028982405.1 odorant receptor 82a [Diachasma alloeum]THK33200.1 odorant receptor 145S [Diachasma alloeum]
MPDSEDFWNHPYYKMVRRVTSFMGQWPYQSTGVHIATAIVTFSIIGMMLTIQISALWINRDDFEVVLDCTAPFIIDVALLTKYVNNCCHYKTMVYLLEQIKCNWNILPKNNGLHMLHDYSAFGRKFARIYMTAIWLSVVSYVTEPLQERLTVYLLYPNVTLAKRFSMPMEFGPVDVDTWYYYLWCATSFGILTRLTVIGSCDLLMFTFAEHANGLLKGLGYVIEHLPPHDDFAGNDESFEYMRRCAMIHSRAIEFAEHVRDIYLWSFFGIIGLNMILMSITGVQIVNNMDDSKKLVKFAVNMITQMMHLFVECFIAQRVMDASFDLKETITNAKWYDASIKTQKLIPLMLLRAQNPVVLTAGKVIVMGMDTYAVVLKTAASYFTVFLAMQ